jgi:hypothetical protein
MSVGIIIKGSPYVRGNSDTWNGRRKDELHRRRLELAEKIKDGILSKSQMNRGEEGEPEFDRQVKKYSQWVTTKDKEIREWQNINREFKKHGEEGKSHTLDDLRKEGRFKFD